MEDHTVKLADEDKVAARLTISVRELSTSDNTSEVEKGSSSLARTEDQNLLAEPGMAVEGR